MRHLHILCEGQTEEIIASDVLRSHFSSADVYLTWSILTTKRPAGGSAFKGGVSTWSKLQRELLLLSRDSSTTVLTTLLDYYAFPAEAPGMSDRPRSSPHDRVRHVEPEFVNDGVDTAPSKRILGAYPQYRKTVDGPLVVREAGLDTIRSSCPHADDWLRELEARLSR